MLRPRSGTRVVLSVVMAVLLGACGAATTNRSGATPETAGAPEPTSSIGFGGGGVTICSHYDDSPIPSGYDSNGCWTSPDFLERGPEVIPEVDSTSPLLRIEASGTAPEGFEGTLFFVRVMSTTSQIVLEREWQWPSMEQQIPPGAYQVTAWARTCDGNCGSLDPPIVSCTVDILAEPSFEYTMTYEVTAGEDASCDAPRLEDQ